MRRSILAALALWATMGAVSAQNGIAINVDRLLQVSFCTGAFLASAAGAQAWINANPKSPKLSDFVKLRDLYQAKSQKFLAYIVGQRDSLSTDLLMLIGNAKQSGIDHVSECYRVQIKCLQQNQATNAIVCTEVINASCRKTQACDGVDLPY